jgi:hypothetical protein
MLPFPQGVHSKILTVLNGSNAGILFLIVCCGFKRYQTRFFFCVNNSFKQTLCIREGRYLIVSSCDTKEKYSILMDNLRSSIQSAHISNVN